jgi:hypothetical protein
LAFCAAFPQGLKPAIFMLHGGMAEAMTFQNRVMKELLIQLRINTASSGFRSDHNHASP